MEIKVSRHNVEHSPALLAYAEEKIGSVANKFRDVVKGATILLRVDKRKGSRKSSQEAQVTIQADGKPMFVKHACDDLYAAIDGLHDKMYRQVATVKTRKKTEPRRTNRRQRNEHPMA